MPKQNDKFTFVNAVGKQLAGCTVLAQVRNFDGNACFDVLGMACSHRFTAVGFKLRDSEAKGRTYPCPKCKQERRKAKLPRGPRTVVEVYEWLLLRAGSLRACGGLLGPLGRELEQAVLDMKAGNPPVGKRRRRKREDDG